VAVDTKDRILDVAARMFHEQGFAGTGVATIQRRAGVNSGSLYHFFPSKEALLVGVLERRLEELRPKILEPAAAVTDDPIERVFALLEVYRERLRMTGCTRGCPVGNLALEVGDAKPRVRSLIDGYFSIWVDEVRDWLRAAGERLPAAMDRRALARLVLSVMEGAVMQARTAKSLEPFDESVAQLRLYVDGLLGQAQRVREEQEEERSLAARLYARVVEQPSVPTEQAEAEEPEWRAW
jgi:TetR/AcrR family transcriptional repressor of nem operon